MKKETLYLDTSVISAYYDERAKERQAATIKFWEDIVSNYKVFISEITVSELDNTNDETLKIKFQKLTTDMNVLKLDKKVRALANAYINHGVFQRNILMMLFMLL